MYISYIILSIIIIFYLYLLYIKCKHPFWSKQPVHHYHLKHYNYYSHKIIKNKLTNKYPKYIDTKNIYSYIYPISQERNLHILFKKISSLIQFNYLPIHDLTTYMIDQNYIQTRFKYHDLPCFMFYYTPKQKTIQQNIHIDILGSLIFTPLYIRYKNDKNEFLHYTIYYGDYLCIDTKYRKKQITQKLIYTSIYTIYSYFHRFNKNKIMNSNSNSNSNSNTGKIFISKHEVKPLPYKWFISYPVYVYNIDSWNVKQIHSKHIQPLSFIYLDPESKTTPIYLDIIIQHDYHKKWKWYMYENLNTLLQMIKQKYIYIYILINEKTRELYNVFIWRDGKQLYDKKKTLECISSFTLWRDKSTNQIQNIHQSLYFDCISTMIYQIQHIHHFTYIHIELVSENIDIMNYFISKQSYIPILKYNNYYHLYNMIQTEISPSNCFYIHG
jgi:hypothetical protein